MVAEAMQRILAGESLYQIRKDWNRCGVLTTHGCAWSDRTMKLMPRNPATKGIREYRPMPPDGSRVKTSLMQVTAAWPAIVDADTWQQVSDMLDARKAARNFHQPNNGAAKWMYPFSGLIRCSDCTREMMHRGNVYQYVQTLPGGYNRSIRSAEITKVVEEAVLATFEQITLNPTVRSQSSTDLASRVRHAAKLEAFHVRRDAHRLPHGCWTTLRQCGLLGVVGRGEGERYDIEAVIGGEPWVVGVESPVKVIEAGEPVADRDLLGRLSTRDRVHVGDRRMQAHDLAGFLLEDDLDRAGPERIIDADGLCLRPRPDELFVALPHVEPLRLLGNPPIVGERQQLRSSAGRQTVGLSDHEGDSGIDVEQHLAAFAARGDHRTSRPIGGGNGDNRVVRPG